MLSQVTGPKYQRIADTLRAEIQSGRPEPGARMPAETALLQRFGVALPTLRQAIALLRTEGLLESRHGVGTFVREDRRRQRRSRNRYGRARHDERLLTADLDHRIVFAGRVPAPDHVAEAMGIDAGAEVVVRRRHLHDASTGALEEIGASYLAVDVAAGTYLEAAEVVPKALFLCVEELTGKTYAHARDTWISRGPTPAEIDLFRLATGAAVVQVVHTASAPDGSVLEVSESVWPADRITLIDEYEIAGHAEPPAARSEL